MVNVKGKICDFVNFLIQKENGGSLILNSFATRYLILKEKKIFDIEEYKYLDNFFKELGIIPQKDKAEVIHFKKIEVEKKEENKFFRKRNLKDNQNKQEKDCDCGNCVYKYICVNSKIRNKGEDNLVKDIFFDFKKEIDKLMYNL